MAGGPMASGGGSDRASLYTGRVTWVVIATCIAAASGGLLFGYDNGVAGGVVAMASWKQEFMPELLEPHAGDGPYCQYDNQMQNLFISCLYLSGAIAAVAGSWVQKKVGRRWTIILAGVSYLVGTVLQAAAQDWPMLVIGRLILGAGVGLSIESVPLFLSETAPHHLRGTLNIMFQLMVTIGIWIAQLINFGANKIDADWNWRLSLGLAGVPALILIAGVLLVDDTPNSLVARGYRDDALRVLRKLRGVEDVSIEFEDICTAAEDAHFGSAVSTPADLELAITSASNTSKGAKGQVTVIQATATATPAAPAPIPAKAQEPHGELAAWRALLTKRQYIPQLVICIVMPIMQQFTGINSIMFYSNQIFQSMGHGDDAALLNTCIIGAVNVGCTFVAIALVDRVGRKGLLFEGGAQMFAAHMAMAGVLGWAFNTYSAPADNPGGLPVLPESVSSGVIFLICLFVAGFAWSWGPLAWLVPSEVQTMEIRSACFSITVAVNFLATFIIAQAFPSMLCGMQWGVYLFFGGFVVLMTIFIALCLPETKGVPLEEMHSTLLGHWFWARTLGDVAAEDSKVKQQPAPAIN